MDNTTLLEAVARKATTTEGPADYKNDELNPEELTQVGGGIAVIIIT